MKKNIISIILFLVLATMSVLIIIHYTNKEPDYQNSVTFSENVNETPTYTEATYDKDIAYNIKKDLPIIIYSGIAILTLFIILYIFLAHKKEW